MALILQHLGSFMCMAYTFYPQYLVIILTGFVIFASLHSAIAKHQDYFAQGAIQGFLLKPSGQCILYLKNDCILRGSILCDVSYLSKIFIILAIQSKSSKKHYILIPKDSISAFAYQRLLAHIRAIPTI